MKKFIVIFLLIFCEVYTLPVTDQNSLVISSTTPSTKEDAPSPNDKIENVNNINIYDMDIKSNISNRFAKTLITSKVKNVASKAHQATFSVVLPEKAFISEFVMEIGGKSYKAYVKEKEEAKKIYDHAVSQGQSAAHVAVSARDSNRFTVSVNVEPESKATFLLTYEELLQRENGFYELVLNIHPGQIVKSLHTEIHINESRPLKFVRTPSLRSGNEVAKDDDKLKPSSDVEIINSTSAIVKFNPGPEEQQLFAKNLGTKESDGLAGQFVVQYDVERDPKGGEVLLEDGYFVHFFAPNNLTVLPKQVIFVLDVSGSMSGRKIEQLRDAMKSILTELKGDNLVNIIVFESDVKVWDINNNSVFTAVRGYDDPDVHYGQLSPKLSELNIPEPVIANEANIEKAQNIVKKLEADGGTNIIGGLETALFLEKKSRQKHADKYQPIVIFLTDGDPNVGMYSTDEIIKTITNLNEESNKVPIFSLSFGEYADKSFLRKLSLSNNGFSRHIYEAADASLQLQAFYKDISSPLLSNVNFTYNSEVAKVSRTEFPIYFAGSELVVAGKYADSSKTNPTDFICTVGANGPDGVLILKPTIERPVTSLERLWAYLTIKQILDRRELQKNQTELTKEALDLALKYSFVTDVSSLVVVKPNETSSVNTETAAKDNNDELVNIRLQSALPLPIFAFGKGGGGGVFAGGQSSSGALPAPPSQDFAVSYDLDSDSDTLDSFTSLTLEAATTTITPNNVQILQTSLPWLAGVVQQNGSIVLSQGAFELGTADTTVASTPDCPKTSYNSTGVCTLLKDCPEIFSALTDFNVYSTQYFCPLEQKYAGVCCPKKSTTP